MIDNLYLLTGYEGNSKFIDPEISTIARGEAMKRLLSRHVNQVGQDVAEMVSMMVIF